MLTSIILASGIISFVFTCWYLDMNTKKITRQFVKEDSYRGCNKIKIAHRGSLIAFGGALATSEGIFIEKHMLKKKGVLQHEATHFRQKHAQMILVWKSLTAAFGLMALIYGVGTASTWYFMVPVALAWMFSVNLLTTLITHFTTCVLEILADNGIKTEEGKENVKHMLRNSLAENKFLRFGSQPQVRLAAMSLLK